MGAAGSESTAGFTPCGLTACFGEDNLYLLRPFNQSDLTPAITIRYRYNLNIISAAENDQTPHPRLKR